MLYDETNPSHKKLVNNQSTPTTIKFGSSLSEWQDELEGGYIKEIVIVGAKSHSYITVENKVVIKSKGITLDKANSSVVNFETMKDMILNNKTIESEKRYQFRWDNRSKDIITTFISRSIKSTICEKRTVNGYDTLPFGFQTIIT